MANPERGKKLKDAQICFQTELGVCKKSFAAQMNGFMDISPAIWDERACSIISKDFERGDNNLKNKRKIFEKSMIISKFKSETYLTLTDTAFPINTVDWKKFLSSMRLNIISFSWNDANSSAHGNTPFREN